MDIWSSQSFHTWPWSICGTTGTVQSSPVLVRSTPSALRRRIAGVYHPDKAIQDSFGRRSDKNTLWPLPPGGAAVPTKQMRRYLIVGTAGEGRLYQAFRLTSPAVPTIR